MRVLSIDFPIAGDHINIEVASLFPLALEHLDPENFLTEDSLADNASEKSFTSSTIFFEAIHAVSQKKREVANEYE